MKWGITILAAMLAGCGGGPNAKSGGEIQRLELDASWDRPNSVNDAQAPLRLKQSWERWEDQGKMSKRWVLTISDDELVLELGCETGASSEHLVGRSSVILEQDTILIGEDIEVSSPSPVFSDDCQIRVPAGLFHYDVSLSELVIHREEGPEVYYR